MERDPPHLGGDALSIGQVAEAAGLPITTLRYYEKRGLIDPPARVGGQRRYEPSVLMRLMVITFCRIAGLSLDEIRTIVTDASDGRAATKHIAARRIEAIDEQLDRLARAKLMLASAIRCRCASVERCECGAMDDAVAEMLAAAPRPRPEGPLPNRFEPKEI